LIGPVGDTGRLVDELTTPDVIDHGAPPNGTQGREALKSTIR
jgi:hypothetical protein